ncbi:MAG: hypothetical protein ACOH2K_08465 [Burkholderiaceae bacterium]
MARKLGAEYLNPRRKNRFLNHQRRPWAQPIVRLGLLALVIVPLVVIADKKDSGCKWCTFAPSDIQVETVKKLLNQLTVSAGSVPCDFSFNVSLIGL